MFNSRLLFVAGLSLAALSLPAVAGLVSSQAFVIRDAYTGSPTVINDLGGGLTEFIIDLPGKKGGLGTNAVNGALLGSLSDIGLIRHDDTTGLSGGAAVAPYFNVWVTDGNGHYAVIANEPSNGSFAAFRSPGPAGGFSYHFSMADIAGERAKVYETPGWNNNTSWIHALFGSDPLTFGDLSSLIVEAPDAAYRVPANGVGSGAPDDLNSPSAYGFNWVFGDTQANYVNGKPRGYIVSDFTIAAVPEPSVLLSLITFVACATLLGRRRTRQHTR